MSHNKRMRFLVSLVCTAALVFVVSACGINTVACDCPTLSPTVTFTITDATSGDAIQDPVFTIDGASANGGCIGVVPDDGGADAGPVCKQWQLSLPVGHSTVTVGAPGYQTQTFGLDTTTSGGCCSTGTQLQQQVALSH